MLAGAFFACLFAFPFLEGFVAHEFLIGLWRCEVCACGTETQEPFCWPYSWAFLWRFGLLLYGDRKNHARDRSCFAQHRNNGFAAHGRRRQAPVERAREPGGGKLVLDLFLERYQRQLQFCHATTVSGPGVGPRWLLPTQSVSRVGVWDRLHLVARFALELRRGRPPTVVLFLPVSLFQAQFNICREECRAGWGCNRYRPSAGQRNQDDRGEKRCCPLIPSDRNMQQPSNSWKPSRNAATMNVWPLARPSGCRFISSPMATRILRGRPRK